MPANSRNEPPAPARGRRRTPAVDVPCCPVQTRDAIVQALREERLGVGAKLPSEFVLADRLGVSRSTVREAMKLLEQEGIVEVRRGTGSFVSATAELEPERPITQFESITNMMEELGYEISTVVLDVTQRKANATDRALLGVPAGQKVVETRRLRESSGRICIYSVNLIDGSVLTADVDEIDWSGSVVSLLDGCGQAIVASSAHIRAVDSSPTRGRAGRRHAAGRTVAVRQ